MKTNFRAAVITKVIAVGDVMMKVPLNTRFIAIDRMGYVWAWKWKPTYNELFDEYQCAGPYMPTLVGMYEDGPCRTPQLIELPACA